MVRDELIEKNDHLLVGVSGGADSMCLLHYLLTLKDKYNLLISVAHINHHTRENENDFEQEMVEKFCEVNKIPCFIGHFQYQKKDNFHNEARSYRYRFFFQTAKKINANKIALAHHLDDQVETILFKIIRGNNIKGYTGMAEKIYLKENIAIIRPLLEITKEEIISYCNQYQVPFMVDSSNYSNKYTRNYLRNKIIPLFQKLQPDFNNKIMQFHEQIKEVSDYLGEKAFILTNEMIILHEKDKIILDLNQLKKTHKALIRMILINVVNMLYKENFYLTYEKMKNLFNIIFNDKPNVTFDLGKDIYCVKEYDKITFRIGLDEVFAYHIIIDDFRDYQLPNGMKIRVKKVEEKAKSNNKTLFLCYNSTVWPLLIRNKKNGDFIKTKIGKKKVNRVFIDEKIPSALRKNWPLLVDNNDNIIWVIGIQKGQINTADCQHFIKIELID